MKLKHHFLIWGILLYSAAIIALILLHKQSVYLFFAGEILFLASLFFLINLYKKLVKPVEAISSAVSLLNERNFNTNLISVGQPDIDNLIDVYNKMTQQLRQERIKLRENNYLLDKLIEAGKSGIIIFGFDGYIIKINSVAKELIGFNEEFGSTKLSDLKSKMSEELNKLKNDENRIIRLDGVKRYRAYKSGFMDNGFQRPFIIIEELTHELIKAERQSYEKVIRMMSHEINNSVCAVNSIIDSVITFNESVKHPLVNDIREALEVSRNRNQNLTNFMRNFANVVKIPKPILVNTNINSLIHNTVQLMIPLASSSGVQIKIVTPNQPVIIKADATQIEQVIINCIKNSLEACQHKGVITVQLTNNCLSVIDNGNGISADNQQKLFTPFFSTKPNGQGIGLTIIREVLSNHGFNFSLTSCNNKQLTEFVIQF